MDKVKLSWNLDTMSIDTEDEEMPQRGNNSALIDGLENDYHERIDMHKCDCGDYLPYGETIKGKLNAPIMPLDACVNCRLDELPDHIAGLSMDELLANSTQPTEGEKNIIEELIKGVE